MKGMGQIVTWSARDESLHTESIIKLYNTFIEENADVNIKELQRDLYIACNTMIEHEDAFIDRAFELGNVGLDITTCASDV